MEKFSITIEEKLTYYHNLEIETDESKISIEQVCDAIDRCEDKEEVIYVVESLEGVTIVNQIEDGSPSSEIESNY